MQKLSFFSATLIGIGAIVGGGIFVLGGIAIVEAGPAALLAFFLNGCLALITARSYANLSRLFQESGGAYLYAKRILSVRAAFVVGWMLWLAHIVAALLYALGFSAYFGSVLSNIATGVFGFSPPFLTSHFASILWSGLACGFFTWLALRRFQSGGLFANLLKLVLFAGLIAFGAGLVLVEEFETLSSNLSPFFATGATGLFAAMGYTFIALQGFELIAAASGEINNPTRIVPKGMYASLCTALIVYIPLIFIVLAVGIPDGSTAQEWCEPRKETCIADATYNFLGSAGYWVVSLAAIAATLSALQANLIASASIARNMAVDRTLPRIFSVLNERYRTPEVAVVVNLGVILVLLVALPNAAAAGSAASMAFLICFAFTHVLSLLGSLREKRDDKSSSHSFLNILLPIFGALSCLALAGFQLYVEQSGFVVLVAWTCIGGLLYYMFLSSRAEALDAYSTAADPSLNIYRGRAPVVVVPISNPDRVHALSGVAQVIAPPGIGRILLLSVAIPPQTEARQLEEGEGSEITRASDVVSTALLDLASGGRKRIEGIVSVNQDPWRGIEDVANTYKCETLLLGLSGDDSQVSLSKLKKMLRVLHMNVVILSAPPAWKLTSVKRLLVPIAGKGEHDRFRARLLGGFSRSGHIERVEFLRILPKSTRESSVQRVKRALYQRAIDEAPNIGSALVELSDDVPETILNCSDPETLILLGHGLTDALGDIVTTVSSKHPAGVLVVRRGV